MGALDVTRIADIITVKCVTKHPKDIYVDPVDLEINASN